MNSYWQSIFKLAWKNLFRNSRRTMTSLMTVAVGAMGLMLFQAFNHGMMVTYRQDTIQGIFGYGQVFNRGYYNSVSEKPWENWIENYEQVETELKKIPEIEETYPRLSYYAFVSRKGINLSAKIEGVQPEKEGQFFKFLNFVEGQNLSSDEKSSNEVIIGKGLADALGAKVDHKLAISVQTVNGQMNAMELKVVGIFHTGIKTFDDLYMRMNLKNVQYLTNTNKVELISLKTKGVDHWKTVETQIHQNNPKLEAIPFEVIDKVFYQHAVDFLDAQYQVIRLIILIIVALGIFNTITVGILERKPEVGALRANGESRKHLRQILFCESLYIGTFGAIIGIILAVLLNNFVFFKGLPLPPGPGITRVFIVHLKIITEHYMYAFTLPLATTLLASIWPVHKLLKTSIVKLLNTN